MFGKIGLAFSIPVVFGGPDEEGMPTLIFPIMLTLGRVGKILNGRVCDPKTGILAMIVLAYVF